MAMAAPAALAPAAVLAPVAPALAREMAPVAAAPPALARAPASRCARQPVDAGGGHVRRERDESRGQSEGRRIAGPRPCETPGA
eukprot:4961467-Prymnesium_polylepis.2